jgi:hypothetical protein
MPDRWKRATEYVNRDEQIVGSLPDDEGTEPAHLTHLT